MKTLIMYIVFFAEFNPAIKANVLQSALGDVLSEKNNEMALDSLLDLVSTKMPLLFRIIKKFQIKSVERKFFAEFKRSEFKPKCSLSCSCPYSTVTNVFDSPADHTFNQTNTRFC